MYTMPPPQLEKSWKEALSPEWSKEYLQKLAAFVAQEREAYSVYPLKNQVFNAFSLTPFDKVKVVIMGQDPYHGPGQAEGLSFSVPEGVRPPPSLKNIFKELQSDLGIEAPKSGSLVPWAKQGVLLLNATLTVRAHTPRSHYGRGWEVFTDGVVKALTARADPVIFVLWGQSAKEKCAHILGESKERHFILAAPHPSPYSAHTGFFGSRPFSKINELLKKQGKEPIHWGERT